MPEEIKRQADPRKIMEAAMRSGIIDPKMTIEDISRRFGPDIDQVAGYVAAWDRYVLVVGISELTPEISFRK